MSRFTFRGHKARYWLWEVLADTVHSPQGSIHTRKVSVGDKVPLRRGAAALLPLCSVTMLAPMRVAIGLGSRRVSRNVSRDHSDVV